MLRAKGCGCTSTTGGNAADAMVIVLVLCWLVRSAFRRLARWAALSTVLVIVATTSPAMAQGKKAGEPAPIRLHEFFNVPLPAGGMRFGPVQMANKMPTLFYEGARDYLLVRMRKVLLAHKWTIAKELLGERGRSSSSEPSYYRVWVRKGSARVVFVLYDHDRSNYPDPSGTVVYVLRDK